MAGEWPFTTVGEVADSVSDTHKLGKNSLIFLNTSDIQLGKILHHSYSAICDWPGQAKKSIQRNDILFSEIRPANGRWAYVDMDAEDYVVSTKLMVIRARGKLIVPRFLYHFLTSSETTKWLQHLAESRSGTFPQITFDQVATLDIVLPPLAVQTRIADFLDCITSKIDLNQRMNETLEAMARALFKSWFVDFEPVRAKAEGRDPDLPKHIADLFPDSFEDSELGEIPKGWAVGSILDHARLLSGGTPKTDRPEYWDGPISWASAKDVSQSVGSILIATERSITQRGLDESATQIIPAFCSVIVARGATTGRMVLFGRAMAMNQTCYALISTTETPFALYCRLREEIVALVHAAHGSVFDTITTGTFALSRIVLPPLSAMKAFEERIAPSFQRVLGNINESYKLAALRDTLLPKLISGELRVKDAEKFIGNVI
jgi:type I restriction enzyme, S subunit